ncbi:MAG TPA: cobalamin B12-binding domain-containing protein, partial [Polyangiaceae bacterium]|nr:cobalamin B12-binding domain-containing protein [Polyangiaceae bacterium]
MAALRRCVLLVHPSRPRERTYPLGLAYLAAAAKRAGALVLGCDLRIDPPAKLVELLRQHPFDYVGITALSTTLSEAAFIVQQVRRIQPASFVVVGGPHATLAPR